MAGYISQGSIEQVRAASDIVDVIGAVLPLKKAGANFVGLCPFHKEKSPSFSVSPHKQIFYCFGCHKGGDVFRFIRDFENVDFGEAVTRLAERARIPLVYENRGGASPEQDQKHRQAKEALLEMHEQITKRWQAALANDPAGEIARSYLAKRGVSSEAVTLFRLGYAPDAWDDTVNWAKSKGYDLTLAEQGGLILKRESGGYYDRFRGRLIFPICDEQSRVIGFSARVLAGDEKTAKYVNSPETPLFTKSKVMYGLDKSKRPMLDARHAVVCEGQLDCIACYMAGVTNVVAPQGTAFTGDHARILKRYVPEVVLCFDADAAGQKATVRAMDDLLASGLAIRVASIPAPHDPDSFIKNHGPDAFREIIAKAESFFDYYLNSLCRTHDVNTDQGQQAVVRAMAEAVRKTNDHFLIDKYARKTAARMGVTTLNATAEFNRAAKAGRKIAPTAVPDAPSAEPPAAKPSVDEAWLVKLLILDEENLDWAEAKLDLDWVTHPDVREILGLRLPRTESGERLDPPRILDRLKSDSARKLLAESCMEQRSITRRGEQVREIVRKLRDNFLDRAIAQLAREAGQPDLPHEEQVRLFREKLRLRELKRAQLA